MMSTTPNIPQNMKAAQFQVPVGLNMSLHYLAFQSPSFCQDNDKQTEDNWIKCFIFVLLWFDSFLVLWIVKKIKHYILNFASNIIFS